MSVAEWVPMSLSFVLSIVFPIIAWRYACTAERVREDWMISRPGWRIAGCIVLIVIAAVTAVAFVLGSFAYPFLWGAAALSVSMIVAIALYLGRFIAVGRHARRELLGIPDEH